MDFFLRHLNEKEDKAKKQLLRFELKNPIKKVINYSLLLWQNMIFSTQDNYFWLQTYSSKL